MTRPPNSSVQGLEMRPTANVRNYKHRQNKRADEACQNNINKLLSPTKLNNHNSKEVQPS